VSVLQALNRYYDRLESRGEADPIGWGKAQISWAIEVSLEGETEAVIDLREMQGRTLRAKHLSVPAPVTRTVGIRPNLLWDKTSYVLGRTAPKEDGKQDRSPEEHTAFKYEMLTLIGAIDDPGLVALRRFLEQWKPSQFDQLPFKPDMLDANVVFRLSGDHGFIHERPVARALIAARRAESSEGAAFCLVSGARAPVQRLHPTIKNVDGAQSSGASLVSFNRSAFTSYGKTQGDNSPTSEDAAARYGLALNAMLARGSPNRLRRGIGDATVVFWADASGPDSEHSARAAEDFFAAIFDGGEDSPPDSDPGETLKLQKTLQALAEGRGQELAPHLRENVRFHVLGLSPNAARLSVRFWLDQTFGDFAKALSRHAQDIAILPTPWRGKPPSLWRLLIETTALLRESKNVPPLLAGELGRAVLEGRPYPRAWLQAAIIRLRAGDSPARGWHAAAIKACINRNPNEKDLPVALDPDHPSSAYQLGRLFAVIESAQREALGKVNSSVADRFYASASSTPARVFPSLLRGARNHAADARKRGKGGWIESKLNDIIARLPADLPRTLRLEDQGRFAVGYYHERAFRTPKSETVADIAEHDGEPASTQG
jgi:CRISPR-associated protein Csd1